MPGLAAAWLGAARLPSAWALPGSGGLGCQPRPSIGPKAPLAGAWLVAACCGGGSRVRRQGRRGVLFRGSGRLAVRGRAVSRQGAPDLHASLAEGLGSNVHSRYEIRRAYQAHFKKELAALEGQDPATPILTSRYNFCRWLDEVSFDVEDEDPFVSFDVLQGENAVVLASEWDALLQPGDSTFLEHAFLGGLEETKCLELGRGWQPRFILMRQAGRLVGAVPMYFKFHSDGEFCDEEEWSRAAYNLGIHHHPRLFVGVPFTPHVGRRLLTLASLDAEQRAVVEEGLLRALCVVSATARLSVNVAFCAAEEAVKFAAFGFVRRNAWQACWHNCAAEPYRNFEEFVDTLRVKNATTIRKQRQGVAELPNLHVEVRDGMVDPGLVTPDLMAEVYHACYRSTQLSKNYCDYSTLDEELLRKVPLDLNEDFFRHLGESLPHRMLLVLAWESRESKRRLVGGSMAFVKAGKICGRYWGRPLDEEQVDGLHFECCYHRLIEHAIEMGYTTVEPGNGGGGINKVQRFRGFEPVPTPSFHFIPNMVLRGEVEKLVANAALTRPRWLARRHSGYAPTRRRPGVVFEEE